MLSLHALGLVSLSFSSIVYTVWLLPQIWRNARRQSMAGLSVSWHALLLFGACFDAVYGFGIHLPWLYRYVTLMTLLALAIQHWQWGAYGLLNGRRRRFVALTAAAVALLLVAACHSLLPLSHTTYDLVGLASNVSFLLYPLPQIIKHYRERSAQGMSVLFVCFSLVLNVCDGFSAMALHWDWPSLVGPPLLMVCQVILLVQIHVYREELNDEVVA